MKKPEKNIAQKDPDSVELNETEAGLLHQLATEATMIQQQANTVLSVILRKRNLAGNWKLDGTKLVRV